MAGFRIPKTLAEQGFTGGRDFDWAPDGEATWIGTIEQVRVQEVAASDDRGPRFVLESKGAQIAQRAEVSSIQIGSILPADEGLESPGNRKFFDELVVLSMDGRSFAEELEDGAPGRLRYSQGHLGNLAHALGLTDLDGDYVVPVENFEDLYRTTDLSANSGLAGQRVMFRVKKDAFTNAKGEEKTRYEIKNFMQAL